MDSNLAAADRPLVEIVDSVSSMKRIPRCPAVYNSVSASAAVLPAQIGQSIARDLILHSHFHFPLRWIQRLPKSYTIFYVSSIVQAFHNFLSMCFASGDAGNNWSAFAGEVFDIPLGFF